MAWERLEELGGIQWPCPDESHPGTQFLHTRLWSEDAQEQGAKALFSIVLYEPPVDELDEDYPFRLTTGRLLDSYNTGVQTGEYTSPLRRQETLDMSPEDADRLGVAEGERVRIVSRRGEVEAPVRMALGLRPGLLFMTLHSPDQVDVNNLTIDAWDPKSGTAEFKATAVRVERLSEPAVATGGGGE
jgi:formate dehydrogenase major subunit